MEQFTNYRSTRAKHNEINLLDFWCVILRYKKMIAAIVGAASVLAVVASLMMTKIYRADALIIPVSSKGGGGGLSALASQFGGLASLVGANLPGGAGEAEKFMAILKSRTLTENVISRENLMPVLFERAWDAEKGRWKYDDPKKKPSMEQAVFIMKGAVTPMNDKKAKTIKISSEFKDPQLAARVVNAYVEELQRFINDNAFTTGKRNRIFIEGQLEENKRELLEAGKEINEFYKGGRVSSSEADVDVLIRKNAGSASASHGADEVENPMLAMNDSMAIGTDSVASPSMMETTSVNLEGILSQKADIDRKIAEAQTVKNVPQQVYLTYLMLRRELLAKVNALLTTQYELAKIEESKEDLAFQVIDKAVPPKERYKPKRTQICVMSFMAALFFAVFLAFFRDYLARMKASDSSHRQS